MITPQDIEIWIKAGLPCDHIRVQGDGAHFEAVIVSPEFLGLTRVQQHQKVYRVLGDKMKEEIHALSMQTLTPEEWAQATGG
jgi:acid stress-induced BolA-like protein IbaG/YrbA